MEKIREPYQNRASQIQQFCQERGIKTLCHFTRIENLYSILQQGLIGRSFLAKSGQQFLWNDADRADRCPEANCLSISFPNYQMFYSIREGMKSEEVNDSQWVVLLLDAKVLWELDCAFCQRNAAQGTVSKIPIEERKKPEALRDIFADFYDIKRQDLQIPQNYPTHPQAEVLVFDQIPTEYINAIHFRDATILEQWRSKYNETLSDKFFFDQKFFDARSDHMANRPIFTPDFNGFPYVETVDVEFKWHPGFAKSQMQKTILSLHEAAEKQGIAPILEISRKSASRFGVSLSAFNLTLETQSGQKMSVECAYQGSKVFENGGPYHDLYSASSRAAKTDERLQHSGELVAFNFCGEDFPTEPKTAFYDWLYITALYQKKKDLMQELEIFQGFSDIVFNPNRSLNCQARAAALFVSLSKNGLIDKQIFKNKDYYIALLNGNEQFPSTEQTPQQLSLF